MASSVSRASRAFSSFAFLVAVPYLIGFFYSKYNLPAIQHLLAPLLGKLPALTEEQRRAAAFIQQDPDMCYRRLLMKMYPGMKVFQNQDDPFENLSLVLHRNGDKEPCGVSHGNVMQAFRNLLEADNGRNCPSTFHKYQTDALLTRLFQHLLDASSCGSQEKQKDRLAPGFLGYCDMGYDHTPELHDHHKLVPVGWRDKSGVNSTSLPCHFHSELGVRITSLAKFASLARQASNQTTVNMSDLAEECFVDSEGQQTCPTAKRELHLYAVPAGRVFVFAPAYVGQIIQLPHIAGGDPTKPVYLQVLSLKPRVFDIINFFNKEESAAIVERALQETRESHRIQRSTTGAVGKHVNQQRTSESGFDTEGATAMLLKRRGMELLGFDEYVEGHTDGLQILRYNLTTAYIPHMDWIEGGRNLPHNYDSSGKGGNRFATILLYMSDLGEQDGGETVFTEAWPADVPEAERVELNEMLRVLRESGETKLLEKGSWEERMVAQCRTKLAVRPNSARAVLFYSQHPNGEMDEFSRHGACPILRGEKWAANLWVWNTIRSGFDGNPKNPIYQEKVEHAESGSSFVQIHATFENSGHVREFDNAELYFEDKFWSKLGKDDPPVAATTYKTHEWNVRVNGKVVRTWTISSDRTQQKFTI